MFAFREISIIDGVMLGIGFIALLSLVACFAYGFIAIAHSHTKRLFFESVEFDSAGKRARQKSYRWLAIFFAFGTVACLIGFCRGYV